MLGRIVRLEKFESGKGVRVLGFEILGEGCRLVLK